MNKALVYQRFSRDGQSLHSIDRQDLVTSQWTRYNKIEVVETFVDEGHTARNFDRPDIQALFAFIKRNKNINYLVVAELTRFSREAGDAINMVVQIQKKYNIRIVSAGRSAIYDVFDSNSFLMMGLEFLQGNSENIKRINDTNGGIYTAKATKGRWIQGGKSAPYGFRRAGNGTLAQDAAEAVIIRFIYQSFLNRMPVYIIFAEAVKLGFPLKGNDIIQKIIRNPLYMGYQNVKAWKEQPGGRFPLQNFTPIISVDDWNNAQEIFKKPKTRVLQHADFPLRGVVYCGVCKKPLTGAPSRGKLGKYYNYYKCNHSGHVNASADLMHTQLQEIFHHLNLPDHLVEALNKKCGTLLKDRLKDREKLLMQKRTDLRTIQTNIESLEEKWITGQATFETYNRWFGSLTDQRLQLSGQVERLEKDLNGINYRLEDQLSKLQHIDQLYAISDISKKQQLVREVFDNSLQYKNKVYRTPYIIPVFTHNLLVLKQKHLLEVDALLTTALSREAHKAPIEPLLSFLNFIQSFKVA